jgi:hypothetical protein
MEALWFAQDSNQKDVQQLLDDNMPAFGIYPDNGTGQLYTDIHRWYNAKDAD